MTMLFTLLKKTSVLLTVIVIVGVFLRFYNIGELSFVADEFLDINASYGYFATGEWQAWDFNREEPAERENRASDERAWLYRVQVAELFHLLPPTEAVVRSVSALWGIATIILLYFVTVAFTKNRIIGLLAAFFFSVSVTGIEFDRTLRMYAMFFPAFLLVSLLLFKAIESSYHGQSRALQKIQSTFGINVLYGIPALAVGFVSAHLHQLTGNIVLIVAVYLLVMALAAWRSEKTIKNRYSAYFLTLCFGVITIGVFFPDLFKQFSNGLIFFNFHPSYVPKVFADYAHPLFALFLCVLGAAYLMRTQQRKEGVWITVSFLTILLAAVFLWRRNVGAQYIFFAQSFVIILLASGVWALADFLQKHVALQGKRIFAAVIVLAIFLVPHYAYFLEENNAYHQTSTADNPNYRKVFDYVKKNRTPDDVLITRNFRNYYFAKEHMTVYDFGGERTKSKITVEKLQEIIAQNPNGWLVYADSDETFLSKEAREYAVKTFERVSAPGVRGPISVYRW